MIFKLNTGEKITQPAMSNFSESENGKKLAVQSKFPMKLDMRTVSLLNSLKFLSEMRPIAFGNAPLS